MLSVSPKTWLEKEFIARKNRNAAYSMRAFSRLLDIPSGRVSQILSEKRRLTPELAQKIAERLNFDPLETKNFLTAIADQKNFRKNKVEVAKNTKVNVLNILSQDQFQSIAEPLHFEILSLLETKKCKSDPQWLAGRLQTSVVEIRACIDRMIRLGMIVSKNGKLKLTKNNGYTVDAKTRSTAIRAAHAKMIEAAKNSIEGVEADLRDISSITIATNLKKLELAKTMIVDFRRELTKVLEADTKEEVFRLNIQFFPVTKLESRKSS